MSMMLPKSLRHWSSSLLIPTLNHPRLATWRNMTHFSFTRRQLRISRPFHYATGWKNAERLNNSSCCRRISQCQDYGAFFQSIQEDCTIFVVRRLMVKALCASWNPLSDFFVGLFPITVFKDYHHHIGFGDGTSYECRRYQKTCHKLLQTLSPSYSLDRTSTMFELFNHTSTDDFIIHVGVHCLQRR